MIWALFVGVTLALLAGTDIPGSSGHALVAVCAVLDLALLPVLVLWHRRRKGSRR